MLPHIISYPGGTFRNPTYSLVSPVGCCGNLPPERPAKSGVWHWLPVGFAGTCLAPRIQKWKPLTLPTSNLNLYHLRSTGPLAGSGLGSFHAHARAPPERVCFRQNKAVWGEEMGRWGQQLPISPALAMSFKMAPCEAATTQRTCEPFPGV